MTAALVQSVDVDIGRLRLPGILAVPENPRGLVIFAHGSGSSRLSPRNAHAAAFLYEVSIATLLFDLLTNTESADRRNVFDIPLLASRVGEAISWARDNPPTAALPIGLFGASTGAGAALAVAAARPAEVTAVVSRGGRPDLAGDALAGVRAPTLLIVGGNDREVLALNQAARARMRCVTELLVIPGAGHLFEEPGTLDGALAAAAEWFKSHLAGD
ncbi:MAG: dienelactone hydrolase family protein [Hyphomonadaceae bacterium]